MQCWLYNFKMLFKKSGLIIFLSSNIFFLHRICSHSDTTYSVSLYSEINPCFEAKRILVSKRTESLFRNGPNHCFETDRIIVSKWNESWFWNEKRILVWKQNESFLATKLILVGNKTNPCFEAKRILVSKQIKPLFWTERRRHPIMQYMTHALEIIIFYMKCLNGFV